MLKKIFDFNIKTLKSILEEFIFVFIFIISTTILNLLLYHDIIIFSKEVQEKLLHISYLMIVLSFSIKLFILNNNLKLLSHLFLLLLAIISTYIASFLQKDLFTYFVLASILTLALSNDMKNKYNSSFLNHTQNIFGNILFAFISSIILYLGVYCILSTIKYLFEINISKKIYMDTLIFVFSFLFPTLILLNTNKNSQKNKFSQMLTFILNYAISPLLILYFIILYAYFIKILSENELPKGNLSFIILIFGILGLFTFIFSINVKNKTKLLVFFKRYFFYLYIIPLFFLYFAIYVRVKEYGITENRYILILLAFWLTFITSLFLLRKGKFYFKHIFTLLFVLMIVASISPYNARNVSISSQVKRFENFLNHHKLIYKNKIIKNNKKLESRETKKISSILEYLSKTKEGKEKLKVYFPKKLKLSTHIILQYMKIHLEDEKNELYNEKYTISYNKEVSIKGYNFLDKNKISFYNNCEQYDSQNEDIEYECINKSKLKIKSNQKEYIFNISKKLITYLDKINFNNKNILLEAKEIFFIENNNTKIIIKKIIFTKKDSEINISFLDFYFLY